MKAIILFLSVLLTIPAFAGIPAKNSSGASLGVFRAIQCGSELTCADSSGILAMSLSGLQTQVTATTTTLTSSQCGSTIVSDSADVVTLPEASTVLGCRFTFVCGTGDNFGVNPADGTDQILPLNYAAATATATISPSAGDAIQCTDAGASVTLEAVGANAWAAIGVANLTWADIN